MKTNSIDTKVSGITPRITPKEFVRLWNILLVATKKFGNQENSDIILRFDYNQNLAEDLKFVIERMNSDQGFHAEIENVKLSLCVDESIVIKIDNILIK